jgi:hypothetical protein
LPANGETEASRDASHQGFLVAQSILKPLQDRDDVPLSRVIGETVPPAKFCIRATDTQFIP